MGRNLLSLTFDIYKQANSFVTARVSLAQGWISYIPNFKIFRTGVIRNVDLGLSVEDIRKDVTWCDTPLNISIERLKYGKMGSEFLFSTSVKLVFESDLLPEFMRVWRMTYRVTSFIQSVRRCQNCKMQDLAIRPRPVEDRPLVSDAL